MSMVVASPVRPLRSYACPPCSPEPPHPRHARHMHRAARASPHAGFGAAAQHDSHERPHRDTRTHATLILLVAATTIPVPDALARAPMASRATSITLVAGWPGRRPGSTGDLSLTRRLLYQLSYVGMISHRSVECGLRRVSCPHRGGLGLLRWAALALAFGAAALGGQAASREAAVGRVARRRLGVASARASRSLRRVRASSRLRPGNAPSWEIAATRGPRRRDPLPLGGGDAGEESTSKTASTREAVTLACWPPGPEERLARTVTSASGIVRSAVIRSRRWGVFFRLGHVWQSTRLHATAGRSGVALRQIGIDAPRWTRGSKLAPSDLNATRWPLRGAVPRSASVRRRGHADAQCADSAPRRWRPDESPVDDVCRRGRPALRFRRWRSVPPSRCLPGGRGVARHGVRGAPIRSRVPWGVLTRRNVWVWGAGPAAIRSSLAPITNGGASAQRRPLSVRHAARSVFCEGEGKSTRASVVAPVDASQTPGWGCRAAPPASVARRPASPRARRRTRRSAPLWRRSRPPARFRVRGLQWRRCSSIRSRARAGSRWRAWGGAMRAWRGAGRERGGTERSRGREGAPFAALRAAHDDFAPAGGEQRVGRAAGALRERVGDARQAAGEGGSGRPGGAAVRGERRRGEVEVVARQEPRQQRAARRGDREAAVVLHARGGRQRPV